MNEHIDFNLVFGTRWYERIDKPIIISVIIALFCVYSSVFFIANYDFTKYDEQHRKYIYEQYKRIVSELIIDEAVLKTNEDEEISFLSVFSVEPELNRIVTATEREDRRTEIEEKMGREGIFNPELNQGRYGDLPDIQESGADALFNDQLLLELSRRSDYRRIQGVSRPSPTNYDAGEFDEPFAELYNYVIKRQGNAYINLTPELLPEEEAEFGYRDPDEIQRVIINYKPMIEYCFKKGTTQNAGLQGFVKVRFNISYTGQVIPESIRILDSTINNRQVEQCIKNYIKRWRNFEVLDESMGIARVTQKFIFD